MRSQGKMDTENQIKPSDITPHRRADHKGNQTGPEEYESGPGPGPGPQTTTKADHGIRIRPQRAEPARMGATP